MNQPLPDGPTPNQPPPSLLQLRARRVPAWLRVPVIVLSFAGGVYSVVADVGPYFFVSRVQAEMFGGKHYLVVSGLVTFLCSLVPALILVHVLASFFPMTPEERAARPFDVCE